MKCPKCNGYGEITEKRHQYTVTYRCELCEGTGEYNPTNEEWFCGLETEEKAKFLTKKSRDASFKFFLGESEEIMDKYWLEWLKQPHTPIS